MTEKLFTKIYNTNEIIIDCFYCIFHGYDSFGDEDFEICEKGHIIYPNDCDDFKRSKPKYDLEKENEQLKKNIQEKEEVIEFYQRFCGKR